MVTADGVYGMQLRVSFDPNELEFQAAGSRYHDVPLGWYWDNVSENFVAVSGGRRLSSTMRTDADPNPATLTNQNVATWTFKCLKAGTFNLTYDPTPGSGTDLATKDGFDLLAVPTNATVNVSLPTAPVDGYIKLQGRLSSNTEPAAWKGATVTLTCVSGTCATTTPAYGPYVMTTDNAGFYQRAEDDARVRCRARHVHCDGAAPSLLGGDQGELCRGRGRFQPHQHVDDGADTIGWRRVADNLVDIGDLTLLGGSFGLPQSPADTGPDINGDGWVNIFDLVLAGGNYLKTASAWTP